ncbi:MATE family efflux transporter [Pseudoalteromonas shioyasakiensis]|uniref:Multidrug-efflux transporter n=1 Tax=Pseudoalteromonas shioyasakiensis TaxID=1190813 RepID=A0ABT6TWC1_9GAMM|nr:MULTISPECIES: MATE family efflux transporter [Pseudoalteromonas]MDI4668191.1 MATE family efflux transporter [Pseudoalteromonas shioyasakiensis]MDI4672579.1 MATE family efflux transporter [Pseudoalteromonas shioyasakiensis]MDI4684643.1 MATE family efflux transporter [Pseudoalteromonas shioyasakiensis]MDI4703393.1 MATE family efflux transporter [Pseudoalteromonas shioyasakiensis]NUJ19980.1 MATE family efflux transporter [Pseudoalteromonas sp. 0802]
MSFCSWEAKRLISLAIPVFLAQVTLILMTVVDTVMAGQVSATDLAALSIATGIWNPLMLALQGILLALTGIIAQFAGSNDKQGISHYFQQGLYLALVLAIIGLGLASLADLVLSQLDTSKSITRLAEQYIHFVKWGIFGFLLFSVYRNITEGMGMTKPAFYISLIGLAVNIPANYVFIHGKLGFQAYGGAGCGIATALVFTAMALTQVIYCHFNKKIDAKALLANFKAPKLATIWTITKVGIPISLATFFEVTLFACIPLFIAHLGAVAVAGHQIAASVTTLLFMMPLSLSIAISIRIGNLFGQQHYKQLKNAVKTSYILAAIIAFLLASVTFFARDIISQLYSDNPEVLALASSIMVLACIYQLPDALQVSANGILRGLKYTAPIGYITFVSYWLIGFALGFVLARTDLIVPALGPHGFWIGIIVGLSAAAIMLMFTVHRRFKHAPFLQNQ